MQRKQISLVTASAEAVNGGIFPDISAIAPMAAELDIVAVFACPALEYEDQFVTGAIKRPQTAVRFHPDADVFEFGIDLLTCAEHLGGMCPVHANEMNGAVGTVACH